MLKPATTRSVTLTGPYAQLPRGTIAPTPAVQELVGTQIRALLHASPSYYQLDEGTRDKLEHDLNKIAGYGAALVQEQFAQTSRLGQIPVYKAPPAPAPITPAHAQAIAGPSARQAAGPLDPPPPPVDADRFDDRAVSLMAGVTKDTLNAVAFPSFVADLINGTFNAIVNASIKQMEAFGNLLANVAKTVDQFMADNITDNQAKDWLVSKYPYHLKVDTSQGDPRVVVRPEAADKEPPSLKADLGLDQDVDLDEDAIAETLVPAARRSLAQQRHQMLSTMVLMGINRIVVTSGRIRAKLDFHIDASDQGKADSASRFEEHNTTAAGGGFLGFGVVSVNSVAYVSTQSRSASDEINASVDLMGEVDLKFKSDVFPLERFAQPGMIGLLQGNTANPAANPPAGANAANPRAGDAA
ncbi:hypothetical protein [Nocardioides sp. URHA0020]|uniref:hypothetical protein n=1 Tax=Nocardioides sp. URHA0020 TaxID=1380392 RepID=UPI000685EE50|nr:hypothetical protein [Nocardioides sp. URHA0020]